MQFAILGGGGAMGGLFGSLLAHAGHAVTLVDVAAPAVDALNAHGVTLESKTGEKEVIPVRATTNPDTVGIVDAVVVFVKCYHTESAVHAAAPMLGPETVVLTLQNGWGNAPKIQGIVGHERVLAGVTYHSGTLVGPAHVLHAGQGMTFMGELDGTRSARLAGLVEAFQTAGIEVTPTERVLEAIWSKLALNVCTLPTAALLRLYAGQLIEHEGMLNLMDGLLDEVVAVAQAQGITLDRAERWDAITGLLARAKTAKGSMLQDVEKGRRTEIDVINGAIIAAGAQHNIPTPYNNSMVWLVRTVEGTFGR